MRRMAESSALSTIARAPRRSARRRRSAALARGGDDDGQAGRARMRLQQRQDRKAVDVGQRLVDDHEIRLLDLGEMNAHPPAGRHGGAVPPRFKVAPAALREDPVLGHDEDQEPRRGGPLEHAADRTAPGLRDHEGLSLIHI